ncbi:hypothetical protein KP509_1Z253000 [Ceratopteris richardii]|nr:hypothetical protein KP509_1Z253000 [Ceratopteris richardii]
MILVNTGLKTPVILLKHEVTAGVPITKQARYNFVGIEESTLEKVGELREPRLIFLPEPRTPGILLSNPLNKKIVWSELTKIWRDRDKVKGLIFNLIKGGYAVVIAGFVAPLLRSPLCKRNSSRWIGNRSGSKKFGNKARSVYRLGFPRSVRKSRNRTSRRSRTSKIPKTNIRRRNIVVKELRATQQATAKKKPLRPEGAKPC